jgi:hypothetical protein
MLLDSVNRSTGNDFLVPKKGRVILRVHDITIFLPISCVPDSETGSKILIRAKCAQLDPPVFAIVAQFMKLVLSSKIGRVPHCENH